MKRPRKRQLSVFLLSFLDIMAGGFGAVVLIFLIIDHNTVETIESANRDQLAEVRLLERRQEEGQQNLVVLREQIGLLKLQIADAREKIENVQTEVDEKKEEVEEVELQALDQSETEEELQSEIESKEEELADLKQKLDDQRPDTLEITGTGDRQYLTGLFLGGNRILVAVDTSASMLHNSIVNVAILRNRDKEAQLNSKKWIRAVDTVEWFIAKAPLTSQLQIATYNTEAKLIIDDGDWHDATDAEALQDAIKLLRETPPANGTDLKGLFQLIAQMKPLPENVFLITDSFPTTDDSNASKRRTTIDGRERLNLFYRALRELPAGITVNSILFPFEGDPWAAGSYWALSHNTGGTFMTPSRDWP
ncbi:MAG: VWA domain-containing protein [Gammaproteobacteria bacterium]|nr:VWA domain-containing protein [Gammaproteobacteria bacterium]